MEPQPKSTKKTWQNVYNDLKGLSEEDFVEMSKEISEDLPLQERMVSIDGGRITRASGASLAGRAVNTSV